MRDLIDRNVNGDALKSVVAEVLMSSSTAWRVRMFARRAIPHTPAKRWAYGAAAAIALFALLLGQSFWAGIFTIALIVVRAIDLRRSGARRGRLLFRKRQRRGPSEPPVKF